MRFHGELIFDLFEKFYARYRIESIVATVMPESASEPIIRVSDVYKSFGKVRALQGVSLDVPRGSILGLLGPNGAGKTTLVRILTTLLTPDGGEASVSGYDVVAKPAAVRDHIGLAGQYAAVDENLTGKENLELVGRLYHLPWNVIEKRAADLLDRFSLTDAGMRIVKTYSGGMRRRLDLAASLVGEPEVLFLDEPTTGLDPRSRSELWEIIEELVDGGTTVLLTTQYLEEADYLADTIVLIDQGMVIAEGTARELKSKIGGGVVELHVADKERVEAASFALAALGVPHIDEVSGSITIPVEDGAKTLIEAMRIMDGEGIEISDIELRKPTLDEVFLELTGKERNGK